MLQSVSADIALCHRHAEEARRKALDATDPDIRADFLDIERRWLALAQSYEFAERLGRVLNETERRRHEQKE